MSIDLKSSVRNQLSNLPQDELLTVERCISHYSKRCYFFDFDELSYRLGQGLLDYPDWNRSISFLNKVHLVKNSGNNPTNAIVAKVLWAPLAVLDYVLQESGEAKLKRLIRENS